MTELSVLFSAERIHARVRELAGEIAAHAPATDPLHVVGVLRGGFVFTSDLVRVLTCPVTVDFVRLASYGDGTTPGPEVIWHLRPDGVAGRHVLIVEDVVDTGRTLDVLQRTLRVQHPASVRTVTLLDKPARRLRRVRLDYVGFTIDNVFVVGYGLDLDGRHRELPYLAVRV